MKIVHLVCAFPPYRGGMGNSVKQIVEQLLNNQPDYQVSIVTPNYQKNTIIKEVVKMNSGVEYQVLRLGYWLKFGNAAILRGFVKVWQSADIVHLHYPFYGTDGLVWLLKKLYPSTKLVIHYHMDSQANDWRGGFFWLFRKLFLKKLLKQSSAITCASIDYWQHSIAGRYHYLVKDKLWETPFTVRTDLFQPNYKDQGLRCKDQRLLGHYGLTADQPTLLMVGGLDQAHYFKGVEVLLRALAQVNQKINSNNIQLIIAGEGDLQVNYQAQAKQLGIEQQVVFTGGLDAQQLSLIYNLADLFVLPSINSCEAFGLVLLEAMASGLPCIASDLPGVRRVIDPPHNGLLVKPGDVDDLADKIKLLLVDQVNQLINMGQYSYQRAQSVFSFKQPSLLPPIYSQIIDHGHEQSIELGYENDK